MLQLDRLEADIRHAMPADRYRFRNRLRGLRAEDRRGRPVGSGLDQLARDIGRSVAMLQARHHNVPAILFDNDLPVSARREEIAQAIRDHQVVIICGETGSGKSTQIPKICLSLGRGVERMIGHTQPRRIAARSIAARIAEELASPLGKAVGYKIRFTDATSPHTYIKLMTDGILLAETQEDRFLDQYDTIILDEAHERSLNIDFLIGYLKNLLPKRRDLKLIITSATIDAARFAEHFGTSTALAAGTEAPADPGEASRVAESDAPLPHAPGEPADPASVSPAPVIEVSGRTWPVEVRYRPIESNEETGDVDVQQAVLDAVDELAAIDRGDMLIFMPTERDIHETAKSLREHALPGDTPERTTEILPLYARLSAKDQERVFHPGAGRRIVIATNVAESSLTVPRVRFVIDPGTARISRYSARSKTQRLPIEPVSQASVDQRTGRCGRVGPGICVRLFDEEDYLERDRFTPPEILRTNLAWVILQTKALRLGEIEHFPFLDPPRPEAIRDGYRTLFELGAIDEEDRLTEIGRRLARIPVDPRIGRMILAAEQQQCLAEVLVIASALETQDPRERPLEKQEAADECHSQFVHPDSDFLSYLNLWNFYQDLKASLSRKQLHKACRERFLSFNRMREWLDTHRQLVQIVEQAGLKVPAAGRASAARISSSGQDPPSAHEASSHQRPPAADKAAQEAKYDAIHRAILTGLLSNLAFRTDAYQYTVPGGQKFHLWPGSALFLKKPMWLVASELVETSRRFLRTAARINPKWIEPAAGHLVKRFYSDPFWDRSTLSAQAYEKVTLLGLTVVPRRRVPYGPIDPAAARELMIQVGLVEGKWDGRAEFLGHNQALMEEMERLQKKTRRNDLLRGQWARFEFYDRNIPDHVCDGPRLKKWLRHVERKTPGILCMTRADLLNDGMEDIEPAGFPDTLPLEGFAAPLDYVFDPGAADDGVTVTVPVEAIAQLHPGRLDWLVPGLLEAKVVALIRALPKVFRRALVPAPETAQRVLAELRFGEGLLLPAVARVLSRIAGQDIAPDAFQLDKLPDELRMNVRVVDTEGKTITQGRDLSEIRLHLGQEVAARFAQIDDRAWRRDGLAAWDFDSLPEEITLNHGGLIVKAYPELLDRGDSVAIRLGDSPEKSAHETRRGLRRLILLAAWHLVKPHIDWLPNLNRMVLHAASIERFDLREELCGLVVERAFLAGQPIPRTKAEYEALFAQGRERVGLAVQDVAAVGAPLMEAYHQTRLALEQVRTTRWRYALDDMWDQLRHLVHPGFLTATPWPWLGHLPRYLAGIQLRLDRLSGGASQRDQTAHADVTARWQGYLAQLDVHRSRDRYDPELELYRWMLEEYRVSLFAQQLGTSLPVSPQRLDRQWQKVQLV